MTTARTSRADLHTRVTNSIVADLERGVRPWHKPWDTTFSAGSTTRPLRHNGKPYQGINVLALWSAAQSNGYDSPYWVTYNQAQELDAFVLKGERGTPIVYTAKFTKTETNQQGEEVERDIFFLKEYTVFNALQCRGLPVRFYLTAGPQRARGQQIARAETFFKNTQADIRHGGNRAYYLPSGDYIQVPPAASFRDAESHAATLAHELIHWTGHASRLAREFGQRRWGDEAYAMEELVAELGSAFLCADLTITPEVREDHASYIHSWLKVLHEDKKAIFAAASHASQAVQFFHACQPDTVADHRRPGRCLAPQAEIRYAKG